MIRPDGEPEPWLEYCRDLSGWLQEHAQFLVRARPDPAKIAILLAPENEVFFYCHDRSLERYWAGVLGAYALLEDSGHAVDFLHARQLLEGRGAQYQCLVAPVPYAYPEEVARGLGDYVRGGGRLLSEGFPGALDPRTGLSSLVNPGMGLNEVFGCRESRVVPENRFGASMAYGVGEFEESSRLRFRTTKKIGRLPVGTEIPGRLAAQELTVSTGEVLAAFHDESAAIVRNACGEGIACLVGCWIFSQYHEHPSRSLRTLVTGLLDLGDPAAWSEEVRVSRLSHEGTSWLLLANESEKAVHAQVYLGRKAGRARTLPGGEKVSVKGESVVVNVAAKSLQVVEVQET